MRRAERMPDGLDTSSGGMTAHASSPSDEREARGRSDEHGSGEREK